MVAFHGEPSLKAAVMDRLREHRRLDEITQGVYFDDDGRGCHLGCITHASNGVHEAAERLFGIEQRIGYWLEAVFEGLPKEQCAAWVIESTEAIPCGADLSMCHHHLAAWLLGESGLLTITDANREAIERVRLLHVAAINGQPRDESAAAAARSAARSAWSAARSAAWSAAWEKIAAKSIEIFRAAPVPAERMVIESCVRQELCAKRLWCPEKELIGV